MRLWHYKLISALPDYHLQGQWRDLCSIARNIVVEGSPKSMLVDRVMDYPLTHLCSYAARVIEEMGVRGFKFKPEKFFGWIASMDIANFPEISDDELFKGWHNSKYYVQCYHNLAEKHDCGGMTDDEWDKIEALFIINADFWIGGEGQGL